MSSLRERVRNALLALADGALRQRTEELLGVLSYRSERTIAFESVEDFLTAAGAKDKLTASQWGTFKHWQDMDIVFQVTDAEIAQQQMVLDFDWATAKEFDSGVARSFLFLAVDLKDGHYSRSDLAASTRAVNRLFPMPTVVFFRHQEKEGLPLLTISAIHRRVHMRDSDQDVLERVTLIKDISLIQPHRAHLELISELSLRTLVAQGTVSNFDQLLIAWETVLDTGELNRRFYTELFAWFQRAAKECSFPDDGAGDGNAERHVIRMITRLLFVWFLKEKHLVPEKVFTVDFAQSTLTHYASDSTDYYRAVLQNLFFATLNTEIDRRAFSKEAQSTHRDFTKYRYRKLLRSPDTLAEELKSVPFVDGGLFDCLDDFESVSAHGRRVDAFTDNIGHPDHGAALSVPARIFFESDGLFPLFCRYKFTVEENTPLDEDVALDPELLGRTFENLLASYNPETRDTARKATGSYYTPRRVVEYMVDETLLTYFLALERPYDGDSEQFETRIRNLLQHADGEAEPSYEMHHREVDFLITAIDGLTILDPACGSGAFPMGILQKLVLMLSKLDPDNQEWKDRQITRARNILDPVARTDAIAAVEKNFLPKRNYGDFGRKLYLIQNVIHGVDIQPIACQIAKLRFFISLLIEQQRNQDPRDNYGIQALPNLETRFVAADSLIGLKGPLQHTLQNRDIKRLEDKLAQIRLDWFDARNRNQKSKLREQDKLVRRELQEALVDNQWDKDTAHRIATWNPYDQNACAAWFDPEWMFDIHNGFDIVIGNPPYVQLQKNRGALSRTYADAGYDTFVSRGDVYQLFYEKGCGLLKPGTGVLAFITSNSWLRAQYGEVTRQFMADRHTPMRLVELGSDVFENAIVDSSILVLREGNHDRACMTVDVDQLNVDNFPPDDRHWSRFQPCRADPWMVLSKVERDVLAKMRRLGLPLKEWEVTLSYGIKTGYNKAFIVNHEIRRQLMTDDPRSSEVLKRMLKGEDIQRWSASFRNRWLIYMRRGTPIDEYPSILKWMQQYQGSLSKKSGTNEWYELQGSPGNDAHKRFGEEKLFWMDMTDRGRFAYASDEIYCNNKAFVLSGTSLKYLCGVLNSNLVAWFMNRNALTTGMGLPEWQKYTVERIPIPQLDKDGERPVVELVERLIAATSDVDNERRQEVAAIERQVDQLVYSLYGLTEDEIAAVERRLA